MAFPLERSKRIKLVALFVIWIMHGAISLWQFATQTVGDVSSIRLLVMGMLLLWMALNLGLIVITFQVPPLLSKWLEMLARPQIKDVIQIVAVLMAFIGICIALFRAFMAGDLLLKYGSYLDRLLPLSNLMTNVSLEIILLIAVLHLSKTPEDKRSVESFVIRWLPILGMLGILAALIAWTGLGIVPNYKGDWSRGLPAVPLLEWQILLALIFLFGMIHFEIRNRSSDPHRLDMWICVLLWAGAAAFWLSQPVVPNASALKPHEPNFEVYPFIDAQTYDEFSQSVLVGNGFGEDKIPQRPLYLILLVFMHLVAGQEYQDVILVQSLIFAFFPVLLYLFGREFFGRPIGISIALLAIFRDQLSNIVSPFTGNISYSKLYLSEIPTAMLLILFLLIGIRWIRAGFPTFWGVLLGGILGIGMLIRTQVIVALPVLLLFGLLTQPKKIGMLIKNAVFMSITLGLVISPWLVRNWQMTGKLIFDSPESQTINLALRYGRLNGTEPDVLPHAGESSSEYDARLKKMARTAIASDPAAAIQAVTNSFLNHAVDNILLFPLRDDLQSLNELWVPRDAFWEKWEGRPTFAQKYVLALHVFLLSLGLAAAWIRNSWLGFLPLGVNLIYNLWTSLALLSGQRFMLTMDWSIYLYYMIGLFILLKGFLFTLENGHNFIQAWVDADSQSAIPSVPAVSGRSHVFAGLFFVLVGLSLPIGEIAFPQRYPALTDAQILNTLITSPVVTNQAEFGPACLQRLMDLEGLSIVQGRVLYPRYYMAGDGEAFTDSVGYRIIDEGRLVFNMVGQINGRIIFPMLQSPEFFPNGADATLITGSNGEPWFVFIQQDDAEGFYISSSVDASICN